MANVTLKMLKLFKLFLTYSVILGLYELFMQQGIIKLNLTESNCLSQATYCSFAFTV